MRRTARIIGLIVAAFLLVVTVSVRAQGVGERIRAFHSDIVVREDGMIDVQERIEYSFSEPRHGIYRDIPTRYKTDDGRTLEMPIDVLSVTDATGTALPHSYSENRVSIRVRIGDPEKTVTGAHTYVITYRVRGALGYDGPAGDELYWNITGMGWEVPIDRATATVRLPATISSEAIAFKCFTGAQGSTAQDCLANRQAGTVSFAADGPLTVVVGWPTGAVARLEARVVPFIEPRDAVPFLLPIVIAAALYAYWRRNGRDPLRGRALVTQFDAPEGLRPAEVGTLMDEKADVKDLSATVVDLAVRGYLTITETVKKGILMDGKDYQLDLQKEYLGDSSIKPFERETLKALFPRGSHGGSTTCVLSELKNDHGFYAHLPGITAETYDGLVGAGMFPMSPHKVRNAFIGIGIVVGIIGLFLTIIAAKDQEIGLDALPTAIAVILTGIIIAASGRAMPQKTEKGAMAHAHALGFRVYLERAEKYRLQWQEQQNMFEAFLPYAMVFGVADKWSKALADMGVRPPPPTWYHGVGGTPIDFATFNAASFVSSLDKMNSSVTAAMVSAPQSKSGSSGFSSGGGFSGGGGGGGGGGSW